MQRNIMGEWVACILYQHAIMLARNIFYSNIRNFNHRYIFKLDDVTFYRFYRYK